MQSSKSGEHQLLFQILLQNPNPIPYKELIGKSLKAIEQRTYWYFTEGDAQFLNNIYDKKIDHDVLKKRIRMITEEKMSEVVTEIVDGRLTKMKVEEEGRLEVQLGIGQFYEEMPKEEDRVREGKERIKQINEDFKAFKEMIEEKKRRQREKRLQKLALQEEFRKSLEKQKKEEHRQQIQKHIETLKKKQEQRKQSSQKFKAFLQQFKKSKPLYQLMEQQYKTKVQLPVLEESRRKLESLTHRKKPTLEELNQHDQRYIERKMARPQKLVVQNQTIDVPFKSRFYEEEERKLKEREEYEQNGPQWDFLEKQKRYSQFVKQKVKPRISLKLKQSLEQNLSANNIHKEAPDRSKVIEVGRHYLEYMRNLEKKRASTPKAPEQHIKESRYVNYLEELKARSQHVHTSSMDWERDLRDRGSSKIQKRQRVLMKSKQLEQKAMRDEKFISHYNYGRADQIIAKKKQIDQTLLSSIRAKVAVLKDAHQS